MKTTNELILIGINDVIKKLELKQLTLINTFDEEEGDTPKTLSDSILEVQCEIDSYIDLKKEYTA